MGPTSAFFDYFVMKVLAEWDAAEHTDQLRQAHEPGGA